MIKVLKYPDKKLLKPSTPVSGSAEAERIFKKLDQAIAEQLWGKVLGFAAPQIGINKRAFIAEGVRYINPEIVWQSKGMDYLKEGCYSLEKDKFDYPVVRSQSIILKWTDPGGAENQQRFNGRHAQIIQHEFDHIEGRLCFNEEET